LKGWAHHAIEYYYKTPENKDLKPLGICHDIRAGSSPVADRPAALPDASIPKAGH
jgi:hypothetical protein